MPTRAAPQIDERPGHGKAGVEEPGVGLEERMAPEVGLILVGQAGRLRVFPERGVHPFGQLPGGRDAVETHQSWSILSAPHSSRAKRGREDASGTRAKVEGTDRAGCD